MISDKHSSKETTTWGGAEERTRRHEVKRGIFPLQVPYSSERVPRTFRPGLVIRLDLNREECNELGCGGTSRSFPEEGEIEGRSSGPSDEEEEENRVKKYETDETRILSNVELERIVLIEQLKATRLLQEYYIHLVGKEKRETHKSMSRTDGKDNPKSNATDEILLDNNDDDWKKTFTEVWVGDPESWEETGGYPAVGWDATADLTKNQQDRGRTVNKNTKKTTEHTVEDENKWHVRKVRPEKLSEVYSNKGESSENKYYSDSRSKENSYIIE